MGIQLEHYCNQCNKKMHLYFRNQNQTPYHCAIPTQCHQRYECRSMAECATVKVLTQGPTPFEILDAAVIKACQGDAGTKVSLTLLEAKAIQHALMDAGIK